MSLKTFQNGADKDSLFSYVNTDPLMKRMLTDQPESQDDADVQHQREIEQVKKSDEFRNMKRSLRIGGRPVPDEKLVEMILHRREVVKARQQREAQQQQTEEQ